MGFLIVFLLFFFAASPASALQCYVVSGLTKDHNGAFKEDLYLSGKMKIKGNECKVFKSWKELSDYIDGASLKNNEKIFIVQASHGGPGGSADLDSQYTESDEILSTLNSLSSKYQLGVILESCFSGDLLKKKLISDSDQNDLNLLGNLCLITESTFGRVSRGNIPSVENYKNLEEYFKDNPKGLISSASWDESGVSQYIKNNEIQSGLQMLLNINSFLLSPVGPQCTSISFFDKLDPLNKQIISGCISDDLLQAIVDYEPSTMMSDKEQSSLSEYLLTFYREENRDISNSECYKNLFSHFHQYFFDSQFGYISKTTTYVAQILKAFTTSDYFKSCKQFISSGVNSYYGMNGNNGLNQLEEDVMFSGFLGKFFPIFSYKYNLNNFLKSKLKEKGLLDQFDRIDYQKLSKGPDNKCDFTKNDQIMKNIVGDHFFMFDYIEKSGSSSNPSDISIFSTTPIMKMFQLSSLEKKELNSAKDRARRKACRDFVID